MLVCRQLVIQLTDRCNAYCPQCGMRVTEPFKRSTLSSDDIKRILDRAGQAGVNIVSFTGGEPLLYVDELAALIRHAGEAGIKYIRTGTNGFMFMNSGGESFKSRVKKLAETLAATPLGNFWISVDSAIPAVHEEMRGFRGVMAGIEKALPIFEECGIYPSANLGINRNIAGKDTSAWDDPEKGSDGLDDLFHERMKEGFRQFYRLVIDMGFTIVNACYPMSVAENGEDGGSGGSGGSASSKGHGEDAENGKNSDDGGPEELSAVYRATSTSRIVHFSSTEKALIFKALMDVIPEFRSKIRIFSPLSSLRSLHGFHGGQGHLPYPCRGGIDFFYVDARDGSTYPCGYRGNESLGKFWDLGWPAVSAKPDCRKCDWECFRDPSELLGPLLEGRSDPLKLLRRLRRDSRFFRIWLDDLRYYYACGFFNGRKPPDYFRLRRFRPLCH